jgi:STAM-binding protein
MLTSQGLRRLHVPGDLIDTFLLIAEPNTLTPPRGIETCGILAGGLTAAGDLEVTTLVIPKQTGGPDNCTMLKEEELFEFCLSRSLMTLGWIHVRNYSCVCVRVCV